jgi:hypothetical protein
MEGNYRISLDVHAFVRLWRLGQRQGDNCGSNNTIEAREVMPYRAGPRILTHLHEKEKATPFMGSLLAWSFALAISLQRRAEAVEY